MAIRASDWRRSCVGTRALHHRNNNSDADHLTETLNHYFGGWPTQAVFACVGTLSYDAAGDVTNDGVNQYIYNANGQICAVESYDVALGMMIMTGYIYDADGNRVAKGSITTWGSCDPVTNGFIAGSQTDYVRDQSGNPLSEFVPGTNGAITLQSTNVWADGMLIATDDSTETHFYLNDWLGTRRVQTSYSGAVEQTCASQPFGDTDNCTSGILFTGKERDEESGLDNFGARYYASSMGRFLSPDIPFYDGDLTDPQKLNLYSYVQNNPLTNIDPNGHDCIYASSVGFEVIRGDCLSDTDSGIYVNGTVTSLNYNSSNNSLGFTYAAYDTGNLGTGIITGVPTQQPMDEGAVIDESGNEIIGIAGGMAADYLAGRIVGALFGRGAEAAGEATVEDILKGATREGGTRADIYSKPGGVAQAKKDFNSLGGIAVKTGDVTIKDLPGGGRAVLRTDPSTWSTDGRPSLDIQPTGGGYKAIAIRYNP